MNAFTIDEFVRESNRIEGIRRDPLPAEIAATLLFCGLQKIIISDLVQFVAAIQPDAKPRFVAGLDVRVGNHYPPRGGPHVQHALQGIVDDANSRRSSFATHVDYETLHPFTDGNGRSGRVLWLWMFGGIERAPLGFLHHFYYQTLQNSRATKP